MLIDHMIRTFSKNVIDIHSESVTRLINQFEVISNPYHGLETVNQQNNFFRNYMQLVSSVSKSIGTRYNQQYDRHTGTIKQNLVNETFQYVSILETL